MNRAAVLAAIRTRAVLRGEFTLRSGAKSNYYVDKYALTTDPEILQGLGELLAARIPAEVQRIAGAELGAVPLVAATMLHCRKPGIFIRNQRKDYGTLRQLEGALAAGDKVVLLEDVCTSGGQVLEAAAVLVAARAHIVGVIAVIDRMEGARQRISGAGYVFDALFQASEL